MHLLNHSVPNLDGYCVRSSQIVRNLQSIGVEVEVVTSTRHESKSQEATEVIDGIRYHRTAPSLSKASIPILSEWREAELFYKRILEVAETVKPQLLHAHSPATCGLAASWAARKLKIPLVYEIRGIWEDAAVDQNRISARGLKYLLSRQLETYVMKRADRVACICQGLADEIRARLGSKRKEASVHPNAVDIEEFSELPKSAELVGKYGLEGKFVIAYIGSLYAWEGVDLLIDAFRKVETQIPNVHLMIVGGGQEEEVLRTRLLGTGSQANVSFVGRVPHSQVENYYSIVDLLVYPRISSRNTELCTPLKPLEAMAMGKPILVSDVGGLKELLPHGVDSLFEADSVESLASAITKIISRPDLLEQMGRTGKKHVSDTRQWKDLVFRYRELYQELLSQ